ncbi:MAG: hypothetical protein GY944_30270 [bacterium]|nr:hypothetical protein [bacterium]MCP5045336.1 hypothetical protein [bacterium]
MAAAIEETFETRSDLTAGGGGIFDVLVDGRLVFSKHEQGRFPTEVEILEALR